MIDDFVLSGLVARAAERYRVLVIDRPGYGRSSRPRDRLWTPAAQAELIHRALRFPVERLLLVCGYYYPTVRLDAPLLLPPALLLVGDLMRYTVSPLRATGEDAAVLCPPRTRWRANIET